MEFTSASAGKYLRRLQDEKDHLLRQESERSAYVRAEGEAAADAEGMHTLRTLGRNLAWLAKCLDAGRAAGIEPPALEPKPMTNFVRDDLLEA